MRARSGPPPEPDALRRDHDRAGWTVLPARRIGKPPPWPLEPPASTREQVLWGRERRRPQALMWERNGQEFEVALYVRTLAVAEQPGARTDVRTLVKQQMEYLAISLPGLARNRWLVEPGDQHGGTPGPDATPRRPSARERFEVIGREST